MRQRKPTPYGLDLRARLRAKIASMDWEEIFDLCEQMIPRGCSSRIPPVTAMSVSGPTLVITKKLGQMLETYKASDIVSPELGFLPGAARDEYLTWYVNQVLPTARQGFYSRELAKLQGLQALRKLMIQAKVI
jgi:hypothetical protein